MAVIPAGNDDGPWKYMPGIANQLAQDSRLYATMADKMRQLHLEEEAQRQRDTIAHGRRLSLKKAGGGGRRSSGGFSSPVTEAEAREMATGKIKYHKGTELPDQGAALSTPIEPIRPIRDRQGNIKGWLVRPKSPGTTSGAAPAVPTASVPTFKNGKPVGTMPVAPEVQQPLAPATVPTKRYKLDPATGRAVPIEAAPAASAADDEEE